jgi:hypothetical protein
VVRERSAKPLCVSSILTRASNKSSCKNRTFLKVLQLDDDENPMAVFDLGVGEDCGQSRA